MYSMAGRRCHWMGFLDTKGHDSEQRGSSVLKNYFIHDSGEYTHTFSLFVVSCESAKWGSYQAKLMDLLQMNFR